MSALIATQVKGRAEATVPETTAEGMCRYVVNLANDVYNEDCKGVGLQTREGTPQRYLAAHLHYSGYDVRIEGALHELCQVGEASFTSAIRRYDILAGKGAVKVSMCALLCGVLQLPCDVHWFGGATPLLQTLWQPATTHGPLVLGMSEC